MRTINLGQCPYFIVAQIVRNLTFSLICSLNSYPQTYPCHFIKNQTNKWKTPFPSILTMEEEFSHMQKQPGIRNPIIPTSAEFTNV